jgi:hypothetical protein
MEDHLEALLEMDFCTKPPNFGVEAHMEAPLEMLLTTGRSWKQMGNVYCTSIVR